MGNLNPKHAISGSNVHSLDRRYRANLVRRRITSEAVGRSAERGLF